MTTVLAALLLALQNEEWPQFKFDARHSGNAPERSVKTPLGLLAAVQLGDAILSAPVVGEGRAYFATLGSKIYAVGYEGSAAWTWDFVKEVIKFEGDRWSGEDWLKFKKGRVTWKEHFCCSRDLSLSGKTV